MPPSVTSNSDDYVIKQRSLVVTPLFYAGVINRQVGQLTSAGARTMDRSSVAFGRLTYRIQSMLPEMDVQN